MRQIASSQNVVPWATIRITGTRRSNNEEDPRRQPDTLEYQYKLTGQDVRCRVR